MVIKPIIVFCGTASEKAKSSEKFFD